MKDELSVTPSPDTDGTDGDVVSLLRDLRRQVLSLERKIDLLSGQMQERPRRESPPDRPFRKRAFYGSADTSERPHRHGGGERHGPKKGASSREPFYEKRPHARKPGPGKKRFPTKRRDRE